MFESAKWDQNQEISDDWCHMKTGQGLIDKIYEAWWEEFAEAELILSDSCTALAVSLAQKQKS